MRRTRRRRNDGRRCRRVRGRARGRGRGRGRGIGRPIHGGDHRLRRVPVRIKVNPRPGKKALVARYPPIVSAGKGRTSATQEWTITYVENRLLTLRNARDAARELMGGMMSSKGERLVLRRLRREGLNGPNRTVARLQGPTEDVPRAGRTAEASGDGRVWGRGRCHARQKAARGVDGRGHLGRNRLMDRKRAGVVVVRVRFSQLPFSGLPLRRLSIAFFGGVTLPLPLVSLPQV